MKAAGLSELNIVHRRPISSSHTEVQRENNRSYDHRGRRKKKLKFIQKLLFFHSNAGSFCNVSVLRCYVNLLIENQHCVSHYKPSHPPPQFAFI